MSHQPNVSTFPPAVSASRISGLLGTQFTRYNGNEPSSGGFRVFQAADDRAEFPVAVVEYHGIQKEMGPGRHSGAKVWKAHRERLVEMRTFLRQNGYTVVWGWEELSGEPDTTWLGVVTPSLIRAREEAAAQKEESAEPDEKKPHPAAERGVAMILEIHEAEVAAKEIGRAYAAGKDEAARRMEVKLYNDVLVSIVAGSDDAVDLSAIALSTQKLYFAR